MGAILLLLSILLISSMLPALSIKPIIPSTLSTPSVLSIYYQHYRHPLTFLTIEGQEKEIRGQFDCFFKINVQPG